MPRFFISSQDVESDILYVREDAHHISNVLRMQVGEALTLCCGDGQDYECTIESFEKDRVRCHAHSVHASAAEPNVRLTLFQGVPKSDKMEWIIEKGVETGVSEFVPVMLKRCISRPDDKKMAGKVERWNKISRSAAKQSQRGLIPEVSMPLNMKELLGRFSQFDAVLVCYENQRNSLRELLEDVKKKLQVEKKTGEKYSVSNPARIALVIGPEGGLEEEEVEQMQEKGGIIAGLGPRILRTETAGMVAASVILYEMGCLE